MITRRQAITSFGVAGFGLLLSKVTPELTGINAQAAPLEFYSLEEITSTLETGFEIEDFDFVGESRLANPQDALLELNRMNELNSEFSNRIDYKDASQCTDQFKNWESSWRNSGINYFTNVQRSKLDKDVAFLLGGYYNAKAWSNFIGATQYQSKPAVQLKGDTAGILAVSAHTFNQEFSPGPAEFARSGTLVSTPQNNFDQTGDYIGSTYSTPNTTVIHYAKPVRVGRQNFNKGLVGVRRKNSADQWKLKGLYV